MADLSGDEKLTDVFGPKLAPETIAALLVMTPRAVRETLSEAMARASWENATDDDGRLIVLPVHVAAVTASSADRKGIGFTADSYERERSAK